MVDWELLIARVRVFGFNVLSESENVIVVERSGRRSRIDVSAMSPAHWFAEDPRDAWLLSLAFEVESSLDALETYFLRRITDGEIVPAQIALGRRNDDERSIFVLHAAVGSLPDISTIASLDDLHDALPYLSPANGIGYHRARERIFVKYGEISPKTCEDAGISDPGLIEEYRRHHVRPEDVIIGAASGIMGMNAVISAFGMPADDEWILVDGARADFVDAHREIAAATAHYIVRAGKLADLSTLSVGGRGSTYSVIATAPQRAQVSACFEDLTIEILQEFGVRITTAVSLQ